MHHTHRHTFDECRSRDCATLEHYMKKIINLLWITLPICSLAFAANFVCPNTYQTVMTGYSSAQVAQACGQPAAVASQQQIQTKPIQLQQWVYNPTTSNTNTGQFMPQLIITFNNENLVTQISVSNQTYANNFPCYSMGRIQVGTSAQQVSLQCGQPRYVNNIQQGVSVPVTVTTWTYNFGSYKPQMIFTFENDQLSDIKMGQLAK